MEQYRTSTRSFRSLAVAGATGQQLVIGEPLATGQDRNAFMRVAGVAEWLVPPQPFNPGRPLPFSLNPGVYLHRNKNMPRARLPSGGPLRASQRGKIST